MSISGDQLRFLRLHQRHLVERTQTLFGGAMVRAVSDQGVSATVRLDELEGLVHGGLLVPTHGAFVCTEQGRGL